MSDEPVGPRPFVVGDVTGLPVAVNTQALREGGVAYLTEVFRAYGALGPDNAVTAITRLEICRIGSTGQKAFLSVEYARSDPSLHRDLFVKFSRDFDDDERDNRGKYEMEGEVRLAGLSRLPGFPVEVPRVYFADFEHSSHTGMLITQKIAFGEGAIEPNLAKCMDHEIADPAAYYRVLITALAKISAAHRSGRLGEEVAAQFPFDPIAATANYVGPSDRARLHGLVEDYGRFAARCPRLLPAEITSPAFLARLNRELNELLDLSPAIRRFQVEDPNYIALCHWNANIDNGWFWRDGEGGLHCGLIDWGRVGQMNVAFALWGCMSGAQPSMWDAHMGELLNLFVDGFRAEGGGDLDVERLRLHMMLYVAMMALSYFIGSPARISRSLPDIAKATGPLDPMILQCETARNQLNIMTVALRLWRSQDMASIMAQVRALSAETTRVSA